MMHSIFVKEQKRYTQSELLTLLKCGEEKGIKTLKALKEYGVLKQVKKCSEQMDLSELQTEDIEISTVEPNDSDYYVFTFVGVVIVGGSVIKSYPKYIKSETDAVSSLRLALRALEKYNRSRGELVMMFNGNTDSVAFNQLAVMLFLLSDYADYGSYEKDQVVVETNGTGEILWEKTINESFALISANRPYYTELYTVRKQNDEFDYFKRLHECVLTMCSKQLADTDIPVLFNDVPLADLSDELIEDFGDTDYILYRLENELNVQFNTHKQLILKTLYTFIAKSGAIADTDCFSIFGTNNFNLVWEDACQYVFDDQLQRPLSELSLPCLSLQNPYDRRKNERLIDLIEKPKWKGYGWLSVKEASDTLIPDLIAIRGKLFVIFDAKYYTPTIEKNRNIAGQPGVESVIKQFLYHLAYKDFIHKHGFTAVKNCFLFPSGGEEVENKGIAFMDMFGTNFGLNLEPISIRMIPANSVFNHYINGTLFDIDDLKL